jgi:UDP-glucose:(heptosyl)LPS alpha-1,3-glucosyltransferase
MKIKVAIINERADASLGGAERSAFELVEALKQEGINVDLLAATGKETENIKILFANRETRRAGFYAFGKALQKIIPQNRYDIIHSFLPFDFADVYQPRGGAYPEAIIRNAASFQNKFVDGFKRLTAYANFRRTVLLRAERKLCRRQDGPVIAALSNYVAEQFKKYYGVGGERVVVILNGVKIHAMPDARHGRAVLQTRSKILNEFGIKDSETARQKDGGSSTRQKDGGSSTSVFLFAANNFRLKGLAVLLEAFYLATKQNANPSFLIVAGRGNRQKYLARARQLGIERKIAFIEAPGDLRIISAAADAAVLPTFYDPSSRFILEMLSMGKPVITTRYNGAAEQFTNNVHGRIIDEPGDIEALAKAIVYFADKENSQKAANAIVADNIPQSVSISRVAKSLISLYETILEKKKR